MAAPWKCNQNNSNFAACASPYLVGFLVLSVTSYQVSHSCWCQSFGSRRGKVVGASSESSDRAEAASAKIIGGSLLLGPRLIEGNKCPLLSFPIPHYYHFMYGKVVHAWTAPCRAENVNLFIVYCRSPKSFPLSLTLFSVAKHKYKIHQQNVTHLEHRYNRPSENAFREAN